jgi:low affinity Fe/Cu permease
MSSERPSRPDEPNTPAKALDPEDRRFAALLRLTKPELQSQGLFRSLAQRASTAVGRPWAFASAVATVLLWACLGPLFKFSDTWQLVINTGTTIITFLMVFLIQSAQNRDTEALRLKLDAIILSLSAVSNTFVDLDRLSDEELEHLRRKLSSMANS